jgi:ADP-heptose:LPS heptosyltransferase
MNLNNWGQDTFEKIKLIIELHNSGIIKKNEAREFLYRNRFICLESKTQECLEKYNPVIKYKKEVEDLLENGKYKITWFEHLPNKYEIAGHIETKIESPAVPVDGTLENLIDSIEKIKEFLNKEVERQKG